jgi:hypothetical protein
MLFVFPNQYLSTIWIPTSGSYAHRNCFGRRALEAIHQRSRNGTMVAERAKAQDSAKVIVFCERHAMLAELNPGQRRLSDLINDPANTLLQLERIKINRSDRMDEHVAEYSHAVIKRESVQALMVMSEPARAPQQRISNYVPKQPIRIAALLPSFHVVGKIYLSGKVDPIEFLMDGAEPFAVLREATVTMTARTDKPIYVPTAFLNRSHIELASVIQ